MAQTDRNGMPSATGQPYPATEEEFITPVPEEKTGDTSMSEEIKNDDIKDVVGVEDNPELGKQSPCLDGYVQRGMKPGEGGKMVPNCVPTDKTLFADFGKDYTKSKRLI